MNSVSIYKTPEPFLSNDEIYHCLKYLFSNRLEELGIDKYFTIAFLIGWISDKRLLRESVTFLKRRGFSLQDAEPFLGTLPKELYIDIDYNLISARIYSAQIKYIIYKKVFDRMDQAFSRGSVALSHEFLVLPSLSVSIDGQNFQDNLDEISLLLRKRWIVAIADLATAASSEEGQALISVIIANMAEIEYVENNPGYFENEIKFLSAVRDKLAFSPKKDNAIKVEAHSRIFDNGGFLLWEHLMENFVSPDYGRPSDIAYCYWGMTEDRYIHRKVEYFKTWFLETYNEELGQFRTLKNLSTAPRKRKYSLALQSFDLLNKNRLD